MYSIVVCIMAVLLCAAHAGPLPLGPFSSFGQQPQQIPSIQQKVPHHVPIYPIPGPFPTFFPPHPTWRPLPTTPDSDDVVSVTEFLEETFLKLFRCPIDEEEEDDDDDSADKAMALDRLSTNDTTDEGTEDKDGGDTSGSALPTDKKPLGKCPEPKEVEIVWVIDASGSIGQSDFSKGIELAQTMAKFVDAENGVSPKSTRMAGISFSTEVHVNFNHLKDAAASNIKKVLKSFSEFSYDSESTATRPALQKALDLLNDFAREDAQKIIFIFTDGASNHGGDPCALAADIKVEYPDVNVFSWGIGPNINDRELKCISGQYSAGAGKPPQAQVFKTSSYDSALGVASYAQKQLYNNFQQSSP